MNRYQFEEILFDALYAPMRAAWHLMEADQDTDVDEIDDIVLEEAPLALDCRDLR